MIDGNKHVEDFTHAQNTVAVAAAPEMVGLLEGFIVLSAKLTWLLLTFSWSVLKGAYKVITYRPPKSRARPSNEPAAGVDPAQK
jgi:hypothetical protein